jgi:hypothetical protein
MSRHIKKMNIRMPDGTAAVLSTVELIPGEFETMLATPDFGTEYKVFRATSEKQAINHFKYLREQYHTPELSGKYADLAEALKKAADEGAQAAKCYNDGGTCNMDAATLNLKGWNRKKVEQAAKAAGVGCFVWNLWGDKRYVFPLYTGAQANARTKAAEIMRNSLKDAGYEAGMYYQID